MPSSILTPKNLSELVKMVTRHGKRAIFVSGSGGDADRAPSGKVILDLGDIDVLNAITVQNDRVTIGTGITLGRLTREVSGDNGLVRQAASILANPLVRNRVTLAQALDPESPYFDITTPLVLLASKIRLQNAAGRRTLTIEDFLEAATRGLKKGEFPTAVEFRKMEAGQRTGFFRVARLRGRGSVSAAARMKLNRGVCTDPEIVVSSLTLVPVRAEAAEKEVAGKTASEGTIKRTAALAAAEVLALSDASEAGDAEDGYERTLIEIAVGRTLRIIMEGSMSPAD